MLENALRVAGISVWFDKTRLEWGDDLRSAIDRGIKNCRYGIVIFSKAFLAKKKWTEYELNSLFARESAGKKIILPIWHGITRDDLLEYGAFADRIAIVSVQESADEIVGNLRRMLGRTSSDRGEWDKVITETTSPGSTRTTEALSLAHYGASEIRTLGATFRCGEHAGAISFPGTNLRPFDPIRIVSVDFVKEPNYSCLLGRDILQNWEITFDGRRKMVTFED